MITTCLTSFHKVWWPFLAVFGAGVLLGASSAHAQPGPASGPARAKVIADFRSAAVPNIAVGQGVKISRISDNALEVRVGPFKEHGNQWPLIAFGPKFLGQPVNLAGSSSLEFVLHQLSDGISNVDFSIATANDGTRNMDSELVVIPGHITMTAKLSMRTVTYNDPSEIALIQMVFRPRETETVYRIEPIRAVYDPAVGSPADHLLDQMKSAQEHFNALKKEVASKLPPEQRSAVQQRIAALEGRIEAVAQNVKTARSQQFQKAYRSLSRQIDEVVAEIGRLRFSGAGPLWVWEADRYSNILRQTGPALQNDPLKQVAISMAGNEFRDFVFMVSSPDRDLSVSIAVRPTGDLSLPAPAVEIRQVEYLKNLRGEETGDALLPVNGPVQLPKGESRQFWVRFDTRTKPLSPGRYMFELAIVDEANQLKQVVPGQLEVWPFSLPSYDVLPNNSYAEFPNSHFTAGDGYRQAVQHMKMYGLNQIYVHPVELPRPTGLDDQWRITGYDDKLFIDRIAGALEAWEGGPGDETLHFIISLSSFEELGLKKEGYAFPTAQWKQVFAQWLDHVKSLIAKAGLKNDQWMLVLRDESGEPALIQFEIPLAEAIKSLDPSIRITCNTSTMLSDANWTKRFFQAFDVFQPNLGRDEVLKWMRTSGKDIWVYQCECNLSVMGRDLYSYYRVYGWDVMNLGFKGTGVWTYCAQPASWGEPDAGCLLIYKHPQQGLVHSRRYEIFREGVDDFRYVAALRQAAQKQGPEAARKAAALIDEAAIDITANRQDQHRCEAWRARIAARILSAQ